MKSTNKILFKLLVLIADCLIGAYAYAYDFVSGGLYYDLISLSERTCKLTSGSTAYKGSLTVPETAEYEGLEFSVVEINPNAFNKNITELTIPASVSTIPRNSISQCKLKKLIFKDGVNPLRIDDYVDKGGSRYSSTYRQPLQYLYIGRTLNNYSGFAYSDSLTNIEIGKYVTVFPYLAQCNKLETVYIPDNITKLPGGCFVKCLSLKSVYIGNGVSEISNELFSGCSSLENVFIGNNVSSIGWQAFNYCDRLTNLYIFSDKLTSIGNNISDDISNCLPTTISKIYVPNPARYDNLLKNYYRDYLITINPTTSEYTGKAPKFSYTNNVTGSSVSFDSTNINKNVGEYNTNIDVAFSIGEWTSVARVPAKYTITSVSLSVVANDEIRRYGENNPELSYAIFGFKNGESEEVLTVKPSIETTAVLTSSPGSYPIIPFGAEADNYTFEYERGTLTILKADQRITWEQEFDNVFVDDIIELKAESSSGLSIKYTSTDESIAEIFSDGGKKYVEFLRPGNVSICAAQDGNENYFGADKVNKKISVSTKNIVVSSLSLDPAEWSGYENDTFHITAIILPEDATNKEIEWASNNEQIAIVDNSGNVDVLSPGDCIITARTTDGSNLSAQCAIKALSGIDSAKIDMDNEFEIYNINGMIIDKSATKSKLKSLDVGLYIIKQNSSVQKVVIN